MDEQNNPIKKYVLVAEDDKFYANIYKVKLAKEGYDVVVVGDGQQAISEARKRKPDLILLDLIMPVKDGFETLKDLKADPDLAKINVVVLSSLGQEEDAKRAKDLGATDYFIKTNISVSDMVKVIAQLVGGS